MDPSMLIGFLIRDEADWKEWRTSMGNAVGKVVIHVSDTEPPIHGHGSPRESALEEVESFDEDDELNGE
jgi:cysteine protease ATG4